MPPIRRLILLTAAPVLLAGCGGGSHSTNSGSTTTTAPPATAAVPSTTTSTSSSANRATQTSHAGTANTSGSAPSGSPSSGGAGLPGGSNQQTAQTGAAGGSVGARIPANFTLTAAGTLNPRTVSAPAFVAVTVSIQSGASAIRTVMIEVPPRPVVLHVPPHGRALVTIHGLRAGGFPILVNGSRRGALLIGAAPGP